MRTRLFTPSEERWLTSVQKEYLKVNSSIVSLQTGSMLLPNEQLYRTHRGAMTIDRAIELDAIRVPSESHGWSWPTYDNYSAREDRFIDLYGMSSGLD